MRITKLFSPTLLCGAACLAGVVAAPAQAEAAPAADVTADANAILAAAYPADGPGVAAIVTRQGRPVYTGARGVTASGQALTAQSVFGLGSITKQFTAALADSVRGERTVVIVLVCYVALWTLYAVIAKGSQDIHYDMAEQFGLSHELAFGHAKHPPLAAAVVAAWFAVFPAADWAYYLLAVSTAALALSLAAERPSRTVRRSIASLISQVLGARITGQIAGSTQWVGQSQSA